MPTTLAPALAQVQVAPSRLLQSCWCEPVERATRIRLLVGAGCQAGGSGFSSSGSVSRVAAITRESGGGEGRRDRAQAVAIEAEGGCMEGGAAAATPAAAAAAEGRAPVSAVRGAPARVDPDQAKRRRLDDQLRLNANILRELDGARHFLGSAASPHAL